VKRLALFRKHENLVGESLTGDRTNHASQVSLKFPHKKSYLGFRGWGLGYGDDGPISVKKKY